MKSRANTILAGLALTVPFLVPTIGAAQEFEPVVYVSSTTSGNVDGVSFADEDILGYNVVADSWEMYFDGSDVGLRRNDVNAFHVEDDGTLLLTLKRPQRVGGFWADDSDVIAFSPTSLGGDTAGTFTKYFDGSDVGLSTNNEEIDALARTPDGRLLLSTSGPLEVPRTGGGTLRGADEDLIVFNATSLGKKTGGSFERYFDGSDVGLRNSSEDIWGAWVEPNTGEIVLTTRGHYWVPGLHGDQEDVIVFVPTSLGNTTTGTFYLGWDGDDHGLSGEYLDGLSVQMVPASHDPPQIQASLTNDWVQGWNFTPNDSVTVEIFDGVGGASQFFSDSVPTDGGGYFNLEPQEGVDLVPGTYIVVTGSEKIVGDGRSHVRHVRLRLGSDRRHGSRWRGRGVRCRQRVRRSRWSDRGDRWNLVGGSQTPPNTATSTSPQRSVAKHRWPMRMATEPSPSSRGSRSSRRR